MITLLTGSLRWLARNAVSLALIVLVLYAGNFLRQEWRESAADVIAARDALPGLQAGLDGVQRLADSQALALDRRRLALQQAPAESVARRARELDAELTALRSIHPTGARAALLLATGNQSQITTHFERELSIRLLEHEREILRQLGQKKTLEALQARHQAAYLALSSTFDPGEPLLCPAEPDSLRVRLTYVTDAARLQLQRCRENQEAYRAYQAQKARTGRLAMLPTAEAVAQTVLGSQQALVEDTRRLAGKNSVGIVLHELASFLPLATLILALALATPLLIKTFLYYVVAPIASRRPAVRILPATQPGLADGGGDPEPGRALGSLSAVSRPVQVNPDQELLVHSDYLQSSGVEGRKDTQWLLNARYPFTSLAAGMTLLTRIRPNSPESVVVSATTDPLSEVGVLELAEGEALVLQPRNLVGVLQYRDRPVRITSHWRLGSLTAWLTLQLRYLVFHGPGSLVVKGCRGVRVERAGTGRMINQAATLGFSASLPYSAIRNETFVPYLLGRQGLFNDRFVEGPGIYVYEEMPLSGRKSGITGRGLEGLLDSLMKVFGI